MDPVQVDTLTVLHVAVSDVSQKVDYLEARSFPVLPRTL